MVAARTRMWIIKHRLYFFLLSALMLGFSVFAVLYFGFNFSIDFTGGSIVEIEYHGAMPSINDVRSAVATVVPAESLVQASGKNAYIIRTEELSADTHAAVLKALAQNGVYQVTERQYNLIGPSVGNELKQKSWIAIGVVLAGIILFIAFAFRTVGEIAGVSGKGKAAPVSGVSSWVYGITALAGLTHDVMIPTGIFAFLGSLSVAAQIDTLFITALLAVLGYSVSNTIVVFDRVRENLRLAKEKKIDQSFEYTVGHSISQTLVRSFNTSFAALLVLGALYFFGGESTKNFALVMAIGIIAGTYSSVAVSPALLVVYERWSHARKEKSFH